MTIGLQDSACSRLQKKISLATHQRDWSERFSISSIKKGHGASDAQTAPISIPTTDHCSGIVACSELRASGRRAWRMRILSPTRRVEAPLASGPKLKAIHPREVAERTLLVAAGQRKALWSNGRSPTAIAKTCSSRSTPNRELDLQTTRDPRIATTSQIPSAMTRAPQIRVARVATLHQPRHQAAVIRTSTASLTETRATAAQARTSRVFARTPVASVVVVLAVDPQLLPPLLQQARRLVGLAATMIRIAGSMRARVIANMITSNVVAPEAVDAATAINTAGSMQVRAIAGVITSNRNAPKAAVADEVSKSLRLG